MTATTTERSGQRTAPAAVITGPRQEGARSRQDALSARRAPRRDGSSQSLPAEPAAKPRKPSKSVPVPPLAECLTAGGEACRIPIAGGGFATIDREDYELVAQYCWHMGGTKSLYPVSKSKPGDGKTPVYLHRLVMRAQPGELVDHWNGDRGNARKGNLRKATRGQNAANRGFTTNRSGYFGISLRPGKRARPYRAALQHNGIVWRGTPRATAIEAARDYDAKAREVWGVFASLNFPAPGERQCKPVGAALEARQAMKRPRRHAGGRAHG